MPFRVLFVEDSDVDALIVQRAVQVQGGNSLHLSRVRDLHSGLERLSRDRFDAVLLDLGLPDSPGGLETLRQVHDQDRDIAIVVLTGERDTELALAAVREGAQDYLVKEGIGGDIIGLTWIAENRSERREEHKEVEG